MATLKQAVFAIKDAHKRATQFDSTVKMHRLWIVLNSLERTTVKKPRAWSHGAHAEVDQ